jgi:Protein of unknown function (DUF1580)
MIDITAETSLSLAEAAKLVPPARSGNRCHLSTILRWITKGAKAPDGSIVRLEAARLGGRWLTSREALQRFSAKLTPSTDAEAPAPRAPATRSRASSRAAAELERAGL